MDLLIGTLLRLSEQHALAPALIGPVRYINIAVWESAEAFQAALNHPEFAAYRDRVPFTHYPSVYTVVRA